jgi:glycerol-3-phosphate dehydrogenase (NAD(P)+)
MNISVIGAGGWGTALAIVLQRNRHAVTLWGRDPLLMGVIHERRLNADYLPGVHIPDEVQITSELAEAVADAEMLVLAVPSHAMRDTCAKLKSEIRNLKSETFVNVAKGIEGDTGLRMSEVVHDVIPGATVVTLSGPSHAEEVAHGIPTAVVVSSLDPGAAGVAQRAFMNDRFRVYTSPDLTGVELGGALKNIIALAAGACDGLGLGDNSKAALITRGLAEISRLGVALGAQRDTFSGLSGLGDLVVTCTSRHSRNRSVGERLGKGEKIADILASMEMVAEGVRNAKSAHDLARKHNVRTPIIDEVHAIIYQEKPPKQAVRDLMTRDAREEA